MADRPLVGEQAATIVGLIRICQKYHTLPSPGGMLNQDWFFVLMAMEFEAATSERAELNANRAASKRNAPR